VKTTTIELFGGARIHYIFNDIFKKCIQEMDPFDVLSDDVKFHSKHKFAYINRILEPL